MLRLLLSALCVSVVMMSCLKSDDNKTCPYGPRQANIPASELAALDAYIDTNGITAQKHPGGFYYTLANPGSGTDSMGLCSQIQITYTGKLVNDTVFDKQTNVVFVLGSLIEGWRRGIPLVKKGGEITLYIPPTLGYGSFDQKDRDGKVLIPANSILIFNVRLIDYTAAN